jgi:SAM-dependent methyltransferase
MWNIVEKSLRRFERFLPWPFKYNLAKAGIGSMDISIDRHFEYAFVIGRLKDLKKGVLVDIGGARSLLPPMLAALGYRVIGYDLSPWSLEYPNYEHRLGDACNMTFGDNSIDVCVSISCIEHVGGKRYASDDKSADRGIMEEVLRILKPGGIFIISVPFGEAREYFAHRVYDDDKINKLIDGFVEMDREIFVPSFLDKGLIHYRIGTADEAMVKGPWYYYSVIAIKLQKP